MKLLFFILALSFVLFFSCNNQDSKPFKYRIEGTVSGVDSGKLCFMFSPRVSDIKVFPFKNGKFSYEGESTDIISSNLFFLMDLERGLYRGLSFVIEPDTIKVEIDGNDISGGSKILKGEMSLAVYDLNEKINNHIKTINDPNITKEERDSLMKNLTDSVKVLIEKNTGNYSSVYFLDRFKNHDSFNGEWRYGILEKIKDPVIRRSPAFKHIYSGYLANKNEINEVGKKTYEFSLPDSTGGLVALKTINAGKTIFVEESGSWCGNSTKRSHELDTIYKKYHDKGFEIITVVFESTPERWKTWLDREKFPWINLIEKEFGNTSDRYVSEIIFKNGDYLVDENGIVVANNLSPASLNELLLQKYEPEEYEKYIRNLWELPKNTTILDRTEKIESFKELTGKMENKPFLIDCWAGWCAPCIKEFDYEDSTREFLLANGIESVYIYFEDDIPDDAKWLGLIKKHALEGYHMRTNKKFVNDFIQATHWNNRVPSYYIVDNTGEVVKALTTRPSDGVKFYNEIISALK